nr:MAG TPA: hypothetical protein [Caudoviricetes sp.]
MLIDHIFTIKDKNNSLRDRYTLLLSYVKQHSHLVTINRNETFGPYPPTFITNHMYVEMFDFNQWILGNILCELGRASYLTIGVLLRIATSKLNKLDLTKEEKLLIHTNMTRNIWNEFYRIENEELPF